MGIRVGTQYQKFVISRSYTVLLLDATYQAGSWVKRLKL